MSGFSSVTHTTLRAVGGVSVSGKVMRGCAPTVSGDMCAVRAWIRGATVFVSEPIPVTGRDDVYGFGTDALCGETRTGCRPFLSQA